MILIMNDIIESKNNVSTASSTTSSPSTSSSSLVTLTLENVNRLSERQSFKQEKKSCTKQLFSTMNKTNINSTKKYSNNNNNIKDNECTIKSRRFKSPRFNLPSIQQDSIIIQIQPEQTTKFQHNNNNASNGSCSYRSRRFRQPPTLNHLIKI